MLFKLYPIIDTMLDFYSKPRSMERFQDYLKILQGDSKDDMTVPVQNFNPMAKEHVAEKLQHLKQLKAEELIASVLEELNKKATSKKERIIQTSLALADDLKGAWTNRYTTDYDSKFKLNALASRNFCTPIFWTSEVYTEELIRTRTLQYCLRTLYFSNTGKAVSLEDHIRQEVFVAKHSEKEGNTPCDFEHLHVFYNNNKLSEQYDIIFNFLYGDAACEELAFPTHGIKEVEAGFCFAKRLAFPK